MVRRAAKILLILGALVSGPQVGDYIPPVKIKKSPKQICNWNPKFSHQIANLKPRKHVSIQSNSTGVGNTTPLTQKSNTGANKREYRVITAEVTGYYLGEESTGKTPAHPAYGITASGVRVRETDKVIAAPKHIPFGTVIEIPGYGMAKVLDRGAAVKVKKDGTVILDILFPTKEEALQWGRKRLEVKIYD